MVVISYSAVVPPESGSAPDSEVERGNSCCLTSSPILERRRHRSAVEQLFRKSPALCAVLPRVEARYKQAHLSTIRFEGLPV